MRKCDALEEVRMEREEQDSFWGEQNWPDGTGAPGRKAVAGAFRERCAKHENEGRVTWEDILLEEVYEALAERDPELLRRELIQVAAVAVNWVEAIDRRQK